MIQSLRAKILLGYGLVLGLLVVVLGGALYQLLHLGRASESILSENYRSIRAAEHMINAVERQDSGTLRYIAGNIEAGVRQFQEQQAVFSEWMGRAKDNVTIEGERAVLARIDSAYSAYLTAFSDLLRTTTVEDRPMDRYLSELLPTFQAVREASIELRNLNQQTMITASDNADAVAHRAVWIVGGIGLLALGGGVAFSLILSTRLVRPIRDMRAAAQRIAEGDYDVTVEPQTSDELGRLAEQFNEMAAELRRYRDLNVEKILAEQRKLAGVLRSIDDGLVVVDGDFAVQEMNPAAASVLGVDAQRAEGRHFLEVTRNEPLFESIRSAAQAEPPISDPPTRDPDDILTVQREGTTRYYQYLVTPIDDEEEPHGVILLLRDVTELKEVDQLKTEFVATASHELKTPLTSIGMSMEMIEERHGDELPERDRELLEGTVEDIDRLKALVDDLLDLSKIESGQMEMEVAPVSVGLLFQKATQALRSQAEGQDVALTTEAPDDLPEVRADPTKITWVLNNLVSNALRYTDAGGHIRLSAQASGPAVELSVADDGAGIPYALQPKIFYKFVQVDDERSSGTGLGLSICKEIVEAHGGRIWVDSTPGDGSTFTFTLRAAEGG
jgi:NtrC-family two-component system sensor histidine kinase KinB